MDLMNPFDIGIAIIFAFCLIRGFFRGFIKEVFSIIGAVGGFYCAGAYYLTVARLLSKWMPNIPYTNIVGFLIVFLVVFILISLLGIGVRYLVGIVFLGWVDRFCGVVFGAFKGVLIASILLMAVTTFLPEFEPLIKKSKLYPNVMLVSEKMIDMVPEEMKRKLIAKIEEFNKVWKRKK